MTTQVLVNIGSGNGLLPDGTKPLSELISEVPCFTELESTDTIDCVITQHSIQHNNNKKQSLLNHELTEDMPYHALKSEIWCGFGGSLQTDISGLGDIEILVNVWPLP